MSYGLAKATTECMSSKSSQYNGDPSVGFSEVCINFVVDFDSDDYMEEQTMVAGTEAHGMMVVGIS